LQLRQAQQRGAQDLEASVQIGKLTGFEQADRLPSPSTLSGDSP